MKCAYESAELRLVVLPPNVFSPKLWDRHTMQNQGIEGGQTQCDFPFYTHNQGGGSGGPFATFLGRQRPQAEANFMVGYYSQMKGDLLVISPRNPIGGRPRFSQEAVFISMVKMKYSSLETIQ